MRTTFMLCAAACVMVALCHAAPATLDHAESAAIEPQNDKEVIEIINLSNFGQSDRDKRDVNMLRQLFPGLAQGSENNEDNSLAGSESQNREVRVKFDDQEVAASNNGPSPADEAVDDADADRNKRFLPFGVGVTGGDHNGAAAGGSGNFLFDIIRLIAGSGSGSGATEAGDEKANGPAVEVDIAKGADGYNEGVPGPITRLFVIANRGIANLIQDLILRLAQTSERIVNFKARLVTALI